MELLKLQPLLILVQIRQIIRSACRQKMSIMLLLRMSLPLPLINQVPNNLRTVSTLAIVENQPTGSIIGEFNATDPEGGLLAYHLISGHGDAK